MVGHLVSDILKLEICKIHVNYFRQLPERPKIKIS